MLNNDAGREGYRNRANAVLPFCWPSQLYLLCGNHSSRKRYIGLFGHLVALDEKRICGSSSRQSSGPNDGVRGLHARFFKRAVEGWPGLLSVSCPCLNIYRTNLSLVEPLRTTVSVGLLTVAMLYVPGIPPVYRTMFTVPNIALMNIMACRVFRNTRFGKIGNIEILSTLKVSDTANSDIEMNTSRSQLRCRYDDSSEADGRSGGTTSADRPGGKAESV